MLLNILFVSGVHGAVISSSFASLLNSTSVNNTSRSSVTDSSLSSSSLSSSNLIALGLVTPTSQDSIISSVSAATGFSNSNTTPTSTSANDQNSITAPPTTTPTTSLFRPWAEDATHCFQDNGQFCGRPEYPRYSYQGTLYLDPYRVYHPTGIPNNKVGFNVTADDDLKTYCGGMFRQALTSWFLTAAVTWDPVIPLTTESILESARTINSVSYSFITSSAYTTDVVTIPGSTFTTTEWLNVWSAESTSWTIIPPVITDPWTVPAHSSAYYVTENFKYTPTGICCSSCILNGGEVQVMHWPTPAPTPPVSELVDKATNFTFTSPSIYVAFHSLWATDMCGSVGTLVPETTLAFTQGELSTFIHRSYSGLPITDWWITWEIQTFTEATWSDIPSTDCVMITSTFWRAYGGYHATDGPWLSEFPNADAAEQFLNTITQLSISDLNGGKYTYTTITFVSNILGLNWIDSTTYSYNPCSPYISLPTKIYNVNPLWTNCVPGIQAFFDPPYVLTAGGALSAVTITAADPPGKSIDVSTSAAAGSTPTPLASPTQNQVAAPEPTTNLNIANESQSGSVKTGSPPDQTQTQTQTLTQTSAYLIGTQTLVPGFGITVSASGASAATTLSLDLAGSNVVINGQTSDFAAFLASQSVSQGPTISSKPITTTITELVLPNSHTLSAGGAALTISKTVLSLASAGNSVVVIESKGTSTVDANLLGSKTVVPEIVLESSQTLVAGGVAVTISGMVMILASGGSSVVILDPTGGKATKTINVSDLNGIMTSSGVAGGSGLGGVIASLGGFASSTLTSSSKTAASVASTATSRAPFNGTVFVSSGLTLYAGDQFWIWFLGLLGGGVLFSLAIF